jgi:RNA-directed DNA polymerase
MNSQKYKWNEWKDIDWKIVETAVFKLQKRIFKASQSGNIKQVHRLQRLLTNSYFGKLWATRKVTQDNQGKKTAGVDGVKSLTPKQRLELVEKLKISNKSKPTRRVWIPKANGKKRPLGIPIIEDRVKQALAKISLEPQWEALFEGNSYGFRPGRSAHDAIEAIFTCISKQAKYVLDADITGCFDNINHQKLLNKINTYPAMRRQIKAWLKSGVLDKNIYSRTDKGTPQGGVISPLLANIALNGMEKVVKEVARASQHLKFRGYSDKYKAEKCVNLIRYADDFVILCHNLETIKECEKAIKKWLKEIGLEINEEKTSITHTLEKHEGRVGFDFLGFNIRQYPQGKKQCGNNTKGKKLGFKTLITPSKESIKNHTAELREIIRGMRNSTQQLLIERLNPKIRGWAAYYSTVCSNDTFGKMGHILYQQLRRWAKRRHPMKGGKWVKDRYWHTKGNNHWVFGVKKEGNLEKTLIKHTDTPIKRHTKVKQEASYFDGNKYYWSQRLGRHPEMTKSKATLLKRQKGKCPICKMYFNGNDVMEVDHIIPKSKGGKNSYENLQLLHRHCHDKKTAMDKTRS